MRARFTADGSDIELLFAFPTQHSDGAWHNVFFDKWDHREWFRLDTQDYLDALELVADGVDVTQLTQKHRYRHFRLRMPAQLHKRLKMIGAVNGLSLSHIINTLVIEALEARDTDRARTEQAQQQGG